MRLIIISGHSGSGKSTALHVLEDAGFTCIDNLPAGLLPDFAQHIQAGSNNDDNTDKKYAVSIDARNSWQDLQNFPNVLRETEKVTQKFEVIFFGARAPVLIRRFSETRRRHPLSNHDTDLKEAIFRERELLQPIADIADLTFDTSNLNLHDLRDLMVKRVVGKEKKGMAILFESFGFKSGVPVDAELVFDARCLPNPYWKPELRSLTGMDEPVKEFLLQSNDTKEMISDICHYLTRWLPRYEASNRSYFTVAIGCTGGQHRSVFLSESIAKTFNDQYNNIQVRHRELGKIHQSKPLTESDDQANSVRPAGDNQ